MTSYPGAAPRSPWTTVYLVQTSVDGFSRPLGKPSRYHRSQRLSYQNSVKLKRRKDNCPAALSEAPAYFAEQMFLQKRLPEKEPDMVMVLRGTSLTRENDKVGNQLNPMSFSINPLTARHKDSRGRRLGVSQRNQYDIMVLSDINCASSEEVK